MTCSSRHNGFISMALALAIGAAVVFGGMTLTILAQKSLLNSANENLAACKTKAESLEQAIQRQNKAIDALKKDADSRVKRGVAALAAARQGNVSKDTEIARLKALGVGLTCTAAVAEVRKGLKP